ncbi:MAG: hypothetical protein RLZZ410_1554 [Pseudomonadota bacterium]|jgi:hypothetical protein
MKKLTVLLITLVSSVALAKLPALSPEAEAAADLAKAKTAHGDKVGGYKLCLSQNEVANKFKKAGAAAPAACVNPGPFVAPVPAAK